MPELHSASANQAIHLGVYIQVREFAAFGLRSHSYGSLHFFISIWVTMGKSLLIILITAYEIAGEVGRVACYVPSQRFACPKICKGSSPENFSLKKDRKQCSRKVVRQVQSLSLCSGLDCAYFLGFVRLASLSFPLQAYGHLDKPDVLASCMLGKSQKSNASVNKWQQNVVYSRGI